MRCAAGGRRAGARRPSGRTLFDALQQNAEALLSADADRSNEGVRVVDEYRNLDEPCRLLQSHRPDGLHSLRRVSRLTWGNRAEVLDDAAHDAAREAAKHFESRALGWMRARGLSRKGG